MDASIRELKLNLRSGFVVFLLALPLSIGIAVASGVPATAGLIAAAVGGVFGSFYSGSTLTISGPAAGMIAIVFAAVSDLGQGDPIRGYHLTLLCTLFAGVLQIAAGFARLGKYGKIFPESVVHGMLAAIGIIIISKQIHVLLGAPVPLSGNTLDLLAAIPHALRHSNSVAISIGLLCLVAVIVFTKRKIPYLSWLPAPMIAIFIGVILEGIFKLDTPATIHWLGQTAAIGPKMLLQVPKSLFSAITFPDFDFSDMLRIVEYTLLIAAVASVESLLSLRAVETISGPRAKTNLDRELVSKGICNVVSGAIGGLPVISEIVRSSENIKNGATSQSSNFMHGIFVALCVFLFPTQLSHIPLATLAAVLIFVGMRLLNAKQLVHEIYHQPRQGVVLVTTMLGVVCTDLLLGVLIGMSLELILSTLKVRYAKTKIIHMPDTELSGAQQLQVED